MTQKIRYLCLFSGFLIILDGIVLTFSEWSLYAAFYGMLLVAAGITIGWMYLDPGVAWAESDPICGYSSFPPTIAFAISIGFVHNWMSAIINALLMVIGGIMIGLQCYYRRLCRRHPTTPIEGAYTDVAAVTVSATSIRPLMDKTSGSHVVDEKSDNRVTNDFVHSLV
ncbi:hypothetical protein DFQ27_006134 [Actinomortierella ambigua]|uniref:Uncharacterized protein n=1 Tax=Actinomortierella ambigua TaxID=1343610 RepID=A0A9P6U1X0_9FUNG|nr:hypothetical protein DFQ27_006134 [Actinomortierella ambigua]